MSVELDPVELGFKRPFTREVAETLRLKNPGHDPVAFKVKTTAPKKYAVRPNSGRIEPGETVEVSVLLQAMKEDPAEGEKCRDKFLVQSVAVSAEHEHTNVAQLWANIESTAKSNIQEKKIRVNWLSPDGAGSGVATPSKHASAYDDHAPSYGTPNTNLSQSTVTSTPVGPADSINDRPTGAKNLGDAKADALHPGSSSSPSTSGQQSTIGAAISSVTSSVTNAISASSIPTSSDELKSQLAEAQAQISRLTKQVQDQGLRQRKTDAVKNDATERISSGTAGLGMQQASPTGVPVPITAALCLLSFLLAYLLF